MKSAKALIPEEEKRPHSVDLGGLDRWLYVIPGHRTRPKECDERCDEFVRAGIGNCLKGIFNSGTNGADFDYHLTLFSFNDPLQVIHIIISILNVQFVST